MQREFTARGIPFIRARRDFPREKLGFSVLSARSVAGRAKIKASSQFPCGEFPLLLAAYCAISLSLFEPARILEFVSWVPLERVSSREGKMGGERIDFLFSSHANFAYAANHRPRRGERKRSNERHHPLFQVLSSLGNVSST